jgi:hypothetical protein
LLASITLPTTNITIGSNSGAFSGIAAVVSLNGSVSDAPIPANMFYGNTKMTTITIGSNVTSIKNNAFRDCNTLNVVYVLSSVNVNTATNAFSRINGKISTLYTTPANISNSNLTNQFTNVYLIGATTIPTNYNVIQSGQEKDLAEIFAPLIGPPGPATTYIVKNYNNTDQNKDLSEIFEPYTRGSPQAPETGFTVNGIDLNQKFKPL